MDGTSDGHLYVSDATARSIVVLDTSGVLIRSLGGPGEGPGEFTGVVKLGIGPGDTVHAFDYGQWRQSTFMASGELVSTTPFPPSAEIGQIPELTFDATGRLYHLSYAGFAESLMEALGGRGGVRARGEVALTRWKVDEGDWAVLTQVPSIEVFFQGGLVDAPFGRRPLWAPDGQGGVWYADSGEYTLTKYSGSGEIECVVEVQYAPPVVSAEDRRAYYEAADMTGVDEARLARVRENRRSMDVPDAQPALRRLIVTDSGWIWIQPNTPPIEGEGLEGWHVLSPGGSPIATALLPTDLTIHRATDDVLPWSTPGRPRAAHHHHLQSGG